MMTDEEDESEEDREFRKHFSGLRDGLKSFVVDLADRVNIEIDGYSSDDRRREPSWGEISHGVFAHVTNMFTGLFNGSGDRQAGGSDGQKNKSLPSEERGDR